MHDRHWRKLTLAIAVASLGSDALQPVSVHTPSRRTVLGNALAAFASPLAAGAVVKGDGVSDIEAAQVGAVGLWIDLEGCQICRKGLPATCSGTLIAPDLVLSAAHCLDIPRELNGTLDRVVFSADMFRADAPARKITAIKTAADYGLPVSTGGDLALIKLAQPAPPGWRPVELPLGLLPAKTEQEEAKRRGSPFFPDGVGLPAVVTYGYGQQSTLGTTDPNAYKAGELKRLELQLRTEVRPWAPGFLTTPVKPGTGTCAGDSGGAALLRLQDPQGRGVRQLLLGVQSEASLPCEENQQVYIFPDYYKDFIVRASADLGSPVTPTISWREYAQQ